MKRIVTGALALAATAALTVPPARADQQSDAAAAMIQAFGLMAGAIANANRPPQVIVVPQPYPVYVPQPVCWLEQREVWTDWGLAPRTVQVCQ